MNDTKQTNATATSIIDTMGGKAKGPKIENEELYIEQIRSLRNEQQLRDEDYEKLREKIVKLQKQNAWLQSNILKEKESRLTIEAKISKVVNMKEIETNADLIDMGGKNFFEAQKKRRKHDIQGEQGGSENNMKL